MEDLLNQIKSSPEYAEIAKKLSDSQIRDFLSKYQQSTTGQLDAEGGMMITPQKGYVIKTFDTNTKEKVFINVCSHEIIDLPEQKDLPEVEEHLALRVPLSLGTPRPDHDKSGKICTIYDVVVNPAILEKSMEDSTSRQLIVELCIYHIAQKHKQQLSLKYRLPKLKYKGTMQQQRVRGKKDPKIEVIDKEVFEKPVESVRKPNWQVFIDGASMDIENIKDFSEWVLEVELEVLASGKGINLKCGTERIEMNVGKIYHLSLWMPFVLDASSVNAEFDCNTRKLRVSGMKKIEKVAEIEEVAVKLTPISLSSNDLLFDVV